MYEKGDLIFHIHHIEDFGPGIILGTKRMKNKSWRGKNIYVVYFSRRRAILQVLEEDLIKSVNLNKTEI